MSVIQYRRRLQISKDVLLLIAIIVAFGFVLTRAPLAQPVNSPQPISWETLTVTTTATPLAVATVRPTGRPIAQRCVGVVEAQPVRMRSAGGVAPTATVGIPGAVGYPIDLQGYDVIRQWQVIRDTTATTSATIHVECYGESK